MDKNDEAYGVCAGCKYSAYGFWETYVCTNENKQDRLPMYDAFDSCELYEERE